MAVTTESPSARARAAARTLATLGRGAKDAALEQIAVALERETAAIVEANAEDLAAARAAGQSSALIDRLTLDAGRVLELCDAVRAIAALEDPVGDVVSGWRLPNGLDIQKVRVPLGVLLVVYEARPNVTVDVAGLCLKSGNACLLRGSTSAGHTNAVLLSRQTQLSKLLLVPYQGRTAWVIAWRAPDQWQRALDADLRETLEARATQRLDAGSWTVYRLPL